MSAHSSDSDSEYMPSAPPSPSALSMDSNADTDTAPSSPNVSAMSLDETKDQLVCPPLTLSAMVVDANAQGIPVLNNPFLDKIIDDGLTQLTAPNGAKAAALRSMIDLFESDPETANMYLVGGLADQSMARSIVERYAETAESNRLKERRRNLDLAPNTKVIDNAFDNATVQGLDKLIEVLQYQVEVFAYLIPRSADYPLRAQALNGLILIAQRTAAAPEAIKAGIMVSPMVGPKLGLALKKLVNEAGWPEDKKKQWGYMKRTGMAAKIQEVLEGWPAVRAASGPLEGVVN